MQFIETPLKDLIVIEPNVFGDNRGYFLESFNKELFEANISPIEWIQVNESLSSRGVLRGLHFQKPPFNQAKLVRCVHGEVLDVVVDIRLNSPSYGKHFSIKLSNENKKQLFVPRGFAHGFVVLSESAVFSYMVDNKYAPDYDSGILWNDPELNIDWILSEKELILSKKDQLLTALNEIEIPSRWI